MEYNKELLEIKQRIVETCFLSVADGPIIINGIDEAFTLGVLQANPAVERFTLPADPELDQANPPDVVSTKRNSGGVTATAFGETKTVVQWAEDSRCLVSLSVLYNRLNSEIPPEKAMTLIVTRRYLNKEEVKDVYLSEEDNSYLAGKYGVAIEQIKKIRRDITYTKTTASLVNPRT